MIGVVAGVCCRAAEGVAVEFTAEVDGLEVVGRATLRPDVYGDYGAWGHLDDWLDAETISLLRAHAEVRGELVGEIEAVCGCEADRAFPAHPLGVTPAAELVVEN